MPEMKGEDEDHGDRSSPDGTAGGRAAYPRRNVRQSVAPLDLGGAIERAGPLTGIGVENNGSGDGQI